jgi:hypothetical protein
MDPVNQEKPYYLPSVEQLKLEESTLRKRKCIKSIVLVLSLGTAVGGNRLCY